MHKYIKFFGIVLLLVVTGCATTNNENRSSNDDIDSSFPVRELPYQIDRFSRLSVQGTGSNAYVFNTSSSTIMGETRPLFVVDGIQMGRDLSRVMQMLGSEQQITLDFLTTRRATIRYGEAGKNGVLIINKANQ